MKEQHITKIELKSCGYFLGEHIHTLDIHKNGTSTLSFTGFSDPPETTRINKKDTAKLLDKIIDCNVFSWKRVYQPDCIVMDGESWSLKIYREGKRVFIREGDNEYPDEWEKFCRIFGIGNDRIKTVELSVCRLMASMTEQQFLSKNVDWTEKLKIYIEDSHICHSILSPTGIWETIEATKPRNLDDCEQLAYALCESDEWKNDIEETEHFTFFEFVCTSYDGDTFVRKGAYDKLHVPEDFYDFIDLLSIKLRNSQYSRLFDKEQFKNVKEENDLTFYEVELEDYSNYLYFAKDGENYAEGDSVLVPFGKNNEQKLAYILRVVYMTEEELPFPIEKMKYIVRVADNEKSDTSSKWSEDDLKEAHSFSNNHKASLQKDKICGCFYCLEIFEPSKITEFLEGDNDCDRYGTAICPYCGIDSVIGESSGFPITKEFLKAMKKVWF